MRFIEPAACPTNLFFSLALAPRIQQGVVPCTDVGTCKYIYYMLARTVYNYSKFVNKMNLFYQIDGRKNLKNMCSSFLTKLA